MKKNTYLGLGLFACLSITPTHLLAEVTPGTSATELLEPPELQRQPVEHIIEPLEPSELQRQQAEHNKAKMTAPETSVTEPLEPSELQKQQETHKEEHIIEPLEPSELQRQQAEHNKAIAK